jgi:hypothetical protein
MALASSISCMGNASLDVSLLDCNPAIDGCPADGLKKQPGVAYTQLAIFAGTCPGDDLLAQGVVTGAIKLQTIYLDGSFADVGELKKDKYGFAALLRRDDCSVIGFGCTPADLKVHKHVTIQLSPVLPLTSHVGACQAPSVCTMGMCDQAVGDAGPKDAPGDGDGATKPICTLDLLAANAGKDLPPSIANASVAGPAAVGTPSGFLAIWQEANADSSKAVRQLIADDGSLKTNTPEALSACPLAISNGIAATWNPLSNQGLMAVAWPACADAGADASGAFGIKFTSFTQDGVKTGDGPPNQPVYQNEFMSVNGAAPSPNDVTFLLGALEEKSTNRFEPRVYEVKGDLTATYKIPEISEKAKFIRLASASGVFAIAHEKAVDGGSAVDFHVGVPNANYKPIPYPGSTNAAVAAWVDKAILVQTSSSGLAWSVRNPNAELAKGTLATGAVSGLDVVAINEHFIVVAAETHKITLFRFDIDGDKITAPTQPIVLPPTIGATKLDLFNGTMIAAAGARNRVFITWLNKSGPLGEGATPGGYALLQCE